MRTMHGDWGTKIWLSARDTYDWANRPGARRPCSQLADRRLFAEFDSRGNLVDIAIDGNSDTDVDINEFDAITSDFLRERFGPDHPAIRP